jgi:hypothetical protein
MLSQKPDPAAEFAAAMSLYSHILAQVADAEQIVEELECNEYIMRGAMLVARAFEAWACGNVDFEEFDDVWPYILEDRFGVAFYEVWGRKGTLESVIGREAEIAKILSLPLLTIPRESPAQ